MYTTFNNLYELISIVQIRVHIDNIDGCEESYKRIDSVMESLVSGWIDSDCLRITRYNEDTEYTFRVPCCTNVYRLLQEFCLAYRLKYGEPDRALGPFLCPASLTTTPTEEWHWSYYFPTFDMDRELPHRCRNVCTLVLDVTDGEYI